MQNASKNSMSHGQKRHCACRLRLRDRIGQRVGGERAGSNDADLGECRDFFARHADARMRVNAILHVLREDLAVDCERRATRHARVIGAVKNERAKLPHLGLEQSVCVGGLGTLERVRADEFTELLGPMRGGAADGAHFMHHDRMPAFGELPRGFASGESAADHLHFVGCHA